MDASYQMITKFQHASFAVTCSLMKMTSKSPETTTPMSVTTHRIIDVDDGLWKVITRNDTVEILTSYDLRKLFASGRAHIPGGW